MASCSDDNRWEGVSRVYTRQNVEKLRGSLKIEHTLARHGAERLWKLLHTEDYVHALGALTGNQAVQQVQGEWTAAGIVRAHIRAHANTQKTVSALCAFALWPVLAYACCVCQQQRPQLLCVPNAN